MGSVAQTPDMVAHATIQTSGHEARNWASDDEIIVAVQLDCEHRGVRFRRDLAENVVATYHALRKRQAMGGDGTTSTRQLARDLYPDVGDDMDAWRRRKESVRRWLRLLERQGLITRQELRGRRGAGKSLGLRVGLCDVPAPIAMIVRRGCSSVGYSVTPTPRTRRLAGAECHRRWCPRAGRGAPRRFSRPPGLLLGSAETGVPRAPGGSAPKGPPPGAFKENQAARARGPAGDLSVAPEGEQSPDVDAALDRRVLRAAGEVALRAWHASEDAFLARCGVPARIAAWRDPERARHLRAGEALHLRHLPTILRLTRALARIDRYAGAPWGLTEPRPGAGVRWIEARISGHAERAQLGSEPWPSSLAYFIPVAEEEARRLKHEGAPRVKDARIAAGVRPPRRLPGRPGRGPAIGRDPRAPRPRRRHGQPARGQ